MKIFIIILLLTTTFQVSAQKNIPNLIIEENGIKELPARTYKFDTINIKKRGHLRFTRGGSNWVILEANVVILNGKITYNGLRRGLGTINANFKNISYSFPEVSIGGAGGNGHGNSSRQGGNGFIPNNYIGGGGGSGAQGNGGNAVSGINASGYRGALAPRVSLFSIGGNGGRNTEVNGGLLILKANKIIALENAVIDLSGINGENGKNGKKSVCNAGGGGGGGGAAGGDGGVLITYYSEINTYPNVLVTGGKAGIGGIGGQHTRECILPGQNGESGENGTNGYVDWIAE